MYSPFLPSFTFPSFLIFIIVYSFYYSLWFNSQNNFSYDSIHEIHNAIVFDDIVRLLYCCELHDVVVKSLEGGTLQGHNITLSGGGGELITETSGFFITQKIFCVRGGGSNCPWPHPPPKMPRLYPCPFCILRGHGAVITN